MKIKPITCREVEYILDNFSEEDAIKLLPPIGGGKGGGGSVPSTTTTVQKSEPPEWQVPFLKDVMSRAQILSYKTPRVWGAGGETSIANFTPEQNIAMNMTTARALAGSPLMNVGNNEMFKTLAGGYIAPETNPYIRSYANMMLEESGIPNLDAAAVKSGRYGSDTWGLMRGKALADLGSKIYEPERQRMMQAMQLAPNYAEQDYADLGKLAAVGETKQQMNQAFIDEARRIGLETDPVRQQLAALQQYSNLVQGHYGGTSEGASTTPYYTQPLSSTLIGGGLLGASLLPYLIGGK